MSENSLQSAYRLLSDFKNGDIESGVEIGDDEISLLEVLCKDLLPEERFSLDHLNSLIYKIARADGEWNKKCQIAVDRLYSLEGLGKDAEAEAVKKEFIGKCPSVWYCQIVENL